jgi:hypothetical protein
MSNWRIEAGKAAWNAIKPLAKTGAKTVSEWKNKASLAKLKTAGDAAAQRIKAAAKKIDKVTETLKKQKNILDK